MPNLKELWTMDIDRMRLDKRVEVAKQLKELGYSDRNVETYTSDTLNQDNWDRNIINRTRMVSDPGASRDLAGIAAERVDSAAVRALETFDRVHHINHEWGGRLDDPIKARFSPKK
jgi:hypothetical protein